MENKAQVRVLVISYNHGNYLRQCLDGIFMQKCNFPFEVVVFDDISTDDSWEIIQEYKRQYGNQMVAIQPESNTYQQGEYCGSLIEIGKMQPTKYIAFCEGDDYWTDPYKLQRQYDILEKNPSCSICVCDVELYDVINNCCIGMAPANYNESCSADELINKVLSYQVSFRLNGFLGRAEELQKENYSDKFWNYWAVDLSLLIYYLLRGDLVYLPENMATKRVNNQGSVSYTSNQGRNIIKWQIREYEEDIEWINNFDNLTQQRYHKMVAYYIAFRKIKLYYLYKGQLDENRWVSNLNGKMFRKGFARRINQIYVNRICSKYCNDTEKYIEISSNWMEKEWKRLQKKDSKKY